VRFLADWVGAWDDWELNLEELLEAGDQVVAMLRQRGRAKSTGLPVDMHFSQVWTIRDGKQLRMQLYASPEEALALEQGLSDERAVEVALRLAGDGPAASGVSRLPARSSRAAPR
jgi:hypothetical protein